MRGTIGARGYPWGTKEPSGRSLRGRSAQAQVQVRGYKEEKLELAARTLCFICPSFASCALVRCLFTQCSPPPPLSLLAKIEFLPTVLGWNRVLVCIRSSSLDPSLPLHTSSARPGRCYIFYMLKLSFFFFFFFGLDCAEQPLLFVVLLTWWWMICISRD